MGRLRVILAEVCARVGVDPDGAELIKFTNNAVFRLRQVPVVVRIAGSIAVRTRVTKVVRVARWFAAHAVPAVRLVPDVVQPIDVDGHLATVWQAVPPVGPPPTGADLARLLREIHGLPPLPGLPLWRPFDEVRQRLAEAEGLTDDEQGWLFDRCDEIEQAVSALEYALPPGPIHGDAFLGNLIPGPDGPVICDFDSTSVGPREWDLTPVALGKLRFRYPGDTHRVLSDSYGFDVTTWDGFPVLRQVRELKLVTSVVPILRSHPRIREQWRHRFDTFRRGETAATWTPYR
jgi:hypothetical protein